MWLGLVGAVLLWATRASGLLCAMCRHQGLSMTPPSAPRSRFVFDSAGPWCEEEEVECGAGEDFCLSAFGSPSDGRWWVQKGCMRASLAAAADTFQGQGCTQQVLDLSDARNLPLPNPDSPLALTVCACNDRDLCNEGPLQGHGPPASPESRRPSPGLSQGVLASPAGRLPSSSSGFHLHVGLLVLTLAPTLPLL